MMPSLFVAHGSPMLALERNEYTDKLRDLGSQLGQPEAVVVFSAHWTRRIQTFGNPAGNYETIYDFGGFPDELYRVTYPARGAAGVVEELRRAFARHGLDTATDERRGLDHGVWVVLRHLFPEADVPVVAASVNPLLLPEEQYRIGKAASELRRRNVLIVGSGATVHNLWTIWFADSGWTGPDRAEPWAATFDDWLIERIEAWDTATMFDYAASAPHAALAAPDYEHFAPLLIAMGAGEPN